MSSQSTSFVQRTSQSLTLSPFTCPAKSLLHSVPWGLPEATGSLWFGHSGRTQAWGELDSNLLLLHYQLLLRKLFYTKINILPESICGCVLQCCCSLSAQTEPRESCSGLHQQAERLRSATTVLLFPTEFIDKSGTRHASRVRTGSRIHMWVLILEITR